MFDGLRRIFSRNKQSKSENNGPFLYLIGEKEKLCVFFSEVEIGGAQLTKAIDIIYDNASKGIDKDTTAKQVWEECFPAMGDGSICIRSYDKGKCWEIRISKNPQAF